MLKNIFKLPRRSGSLFVLAVLLSSWILTVVVPGAINTVAAASSGRQIQANSGGTIVYIPMVQASPPGKVYYVSPSGDDSSPGTIDRPWKTISKSATRLSPGDTLYLRGGTYVEAVVLSKSGSSSQPIRVMAYPGETPILEGQNTLPPQTGGAMIIVSGDWNIVSGIEVRNSIYYGVALTGKHNTADHLNVHHILRAGIINQGDYGTVQNCQVWRASLVNESGKSPSSYSSGISSGKDNEDGITQGSVIRNNVLWENWGQGITVSHSDGSLVEGNRVSDSYSANIYVHDTLNTVVNRNMVWMTSSAYFNSTGSNVGIMMGSETYNPRAANVTITNNIAYNNERNLFWFQGTQTSGMNNVLIANNTFVNSLHQYGNVVLNQGTHVNVRFTNNIVVQDNSYPVVAVAKDTPIVFSNNLWSKTPQSNTSSPTDIIGDPLLSKTGSPFDPAWYSLTAASPAINKAVVLPEVTVDFRGQPRGNAPDLGAYEYP